MTQKTKKCIVWDLDNTIWQGTLLEDPEVTLNPIIPEIIMQLDQRGIIHSIVSRNDYDLAFSQLKKFGLHEYFLYPQMIWGNKSKSIKVISEKLNLSLDSFAFIDDQAYERAEVAYQFPEILCLDVNILPELLHREEFNPKFLTEDSRHRRLMYQQDMLRTNEEADFVGPQSEFLSTLNMHLVITKASHEDLVRAEELTVRTNQLNTTGLTYDFDELQQLINSPQHELLIAELSDKFGGYGKIGLVLLEAKQEKWNIKLLLMSCRVLSRGVGTVIINYLRQQAKKAGVTLQADFIHTDKNRMMYMTYKFNGFTEAAAGSEDIFTLVADTTATPALPSYIKVSMPKRLF